MNDQTNSMLWGRRAARLAPFALLLAGLIAARLLSAPAPAAATAPPARGLYALRLEAPGQLAEAQAAGLVLYSRIASEHGDYLLLGGPPDAAGRLGRGLRLLAADAAGASYYLARPAARRAVPWPGCCRVLLDLGDQVLLAASPASAEQLPASGVEIARIALVPQPWPAAQAAAAGIRAITPDPAVRAMLQAVSAPALYAYTALLSGEQPIVVGGAAYTLTTRYTYSGAPIQNAGVFIGKRLQALGLDVEYQVWGSAGEPVTYPNVIGQLTGRARPGEVYLIGGHLDSLPSWGAAPGADDNASGSAAALIAAEILSQYSWDCTLRFTFWTGEEQGLLGSAAYAARAFARDEDIRGYLNLDMIAYNSAPPNNINLFASSSVPGSVDMMALFAESVRAYGLNLAPIQYTDASLGNFSDNKPFWDKGYASILAIEDYYGDFNPYYHTPGDRLPALDMAYYTAYVRAALATFVHLTGCLIAEPTPTATRTPAPTLTPTATPRPHIYLPLLLGKPDF